MLVCTWRGIRDFEGGDHDGAFCDCGFASLLSRVVYRLADSVRCHNISDSISIFKNVYRSDSASLLPLILLISAVISVGKEWRMI